MVVGAYLSGNGINGIEFGLFIPQGPQRDKMDGITHITTDSSIYWFSNRSQCSALSHCIKRNALEKRTMNAATHQETLEVTNVIQGDNPLFLSVKSDGKGLKEVEGMEWVKIPEKREGKGKGKTIAAVSLPVLEYDAGILSGILNQAVNDLRRELVVSMFRAGSEKFTEQDIGEDAIAKFWSEKSFSADSVGVWFDSEMAPLLGFSICVAKGWGDVDSLNPEQTKYVEQKQAAYRGSYVECAAKFPKLNPTQMQELARVLDLVELSGPIVDRIKDKIVPKVAEESLGF